MDIGLLTAPFGKEMNFKQIAEWAGKTGFKALEVTAGPGAHMTADDVLKDDAKKVKKILKDTGVRISSLAYYRLFNVGMEAEQYVKEAKDYIAAVQAIGDGACLCLLAGFPSPGKNKMQTIREVLPGVYEPLLKEAEKRGVKLAFENWFSTNLQHLGNWRALFEVLPSPNLGLNFDPSHLCWQEIDYIAAVDEFKARIFHTHAKDTAIFRDKLSSVGVLEGGWWTYVIPGYGIVRWGEYIRQLRKCGYNGVLSIEHEDSAFNAKEGFEKGLRFLSTLA